MKVWVRLWAVLFMLPLFVLGCGKKPSPEKAGAASAAPSITGAPAPVKRGPALRIAYSDWPGWVAWDIGVQKGFFEQEGVDVDFSWFEYVPSMDAYSAGKVDAVCMTNGDALVTGASGSPSVAVVINDYSNGNDMLVARSGIDSVAALKGKKVGVEVGFVSHLLLTNALASANLSEKDIEIVNVPTDQTPQALGSGRVDAIVAWQPNSGQALKEAPGSKAIFTSADVPGLIYDVLAVNPKSLAERRADWTKVVKVWGRIADFVNDPKNADEAAKIMGARVGLAADEYKKLMAGTRFLGVRDGFAAYQRGDALTSIFHSSKLVDEFQVKNAVYKAPVKYDAYFDSSLVSTLLN